MTRGRLSGPGGVCEVSVVFLNHALLINYVICACIVVPGTLASTGLIMILVQILPEEDKYRYFISRLNQRGYALLSLYLRLYTTIQNLSVLYLHVIGRDNLRKTL